MTVAPFVPDERYDWTEIKTHDGKVVRLIQTCRHIETVPVEGVFGAVVAHLCLTCDAQLP